MKENKQSKKEGARNIPGMSFLKGIRGAMTPAAAKKDKDKEKAPKKPLKSMRMNNKTKKIVEEKYHDDEKKKGEVEICICRCMWCDSLLLTSYLNSSNLLSTPILFSFYLLSILIKMIFLLHSFIP